MPEKNVSGMESVRTPDNVKKFMDKYPHYGYPIPENITVELEELAQKNETAHRKMEEEVLPRLKTEVVATGAGYKLAVVYQKGEKPTLEDLKSDVKELGVSEKEKEQVMRWKEEESRAGQLDDEHFEFYYLLDLLLRKLDRQLAEYQSQV